MYDSQNVYSLFPSMFEFYRELISHSSHSSPEAKGIVGQSYPVSLAGIYFHLQCKKKKNRTTTKKKPPKNQNTRTNKPELPLNPQCMIIYHCPHTFFCFEVEVQEKIKCLPAK